MKPAWARGANYDRSLLLIYTADPGFILGEGVLGTSRLGLGGADVLLPATLTSITLDSPVTVEDGLFVHRETETCTVTATLPAHLDLKGRRLRIMYDGRELYYGTIRHADVVESVDLEAWKPGNTAGKTYRVSLTATSGEELFATAITPGRDFSGNGHNTGSRISSWVGNTDGLYDATAETQAPGINEPIYDNIIDYVEDHAAFSTVDVASPSLLETIRRQCGWTNKHFRYKPWDEGPVEARSNGRWFVQSAGLGFDLESTAILFTDNPATLVQTGGNAYTHDHRAVSYSNRVVGSDPSMFCRGVTIKTANPDTTYGPFRATEYQPNDVEVDLGDLRFEINYPMEADEKAALARNLVATLPLRARATSFTRSLSTPLQSLHQVTAQGPAMALLEHDGVTERVAVLSVTHTITPDRWMVDYELGPEHLLSRESDLDPSVPTDFVITQPGGAGANVVFSWKTPRKLPTDVRLYRHIFKIGFNEPNSVSWKTTDTRIHLSAVTNETPGSQQSVSIPRASIPNDPYWLFGIRYTSDSNPHSGVEAMTHRQGQPARYAFIPG